VDGVAPASHRQKWKIALNAPAAQKYLICNADEGDPGAFMDRAILEGDPFRVVEGMLIAAYAIGASKGYVYCRAEYRWPSSAFKTLSPSAGRRTPRTNIFGSLTDFDITIKQGAGAFVCGEETAILASIEGGRGCPGRDRRTRRSPASMACPPCSTTSRPWPTSPA